MISNSNATARRVLLISDNVEYQAAIQKCIRKDFYHLTVALDGTQGMMRAVISMPDIILLDMHQAQHDGLSTLRMLKANSTTQHTPVLFITAAENMSERLACLRCGAVGYILKPFDVQEVSEKVRIHIAISNTLQARSERSFVQLVDPQTHEGGDTVGNGNLILQRTAANLIRNRLDNPPTPSELSALLGVSKRRLFGVFKSCLGISLFEFTRRERMKNAARLLLQTNTNIIDIAGEVGYSSAANFTTAFREFWGNTPSAYRQGHINQPL